jgi:hypothetical protein
MGISTHEKPSFRKNSGAQVRHYKSERLSYKSGRLFFSLLI